MPPIARVSNGGQACGWETCGLCCGLTGAGGCGGVVALFAGRGQGRVATKPLFAGVSLPIYIAMGNPHELAGTMQQA